MRLSEFQSDLETKIPVSKQQMFHDIARASQEESWWGRGYITTNYPYIPLTLECFEPLITKMMQGMKPGMRVVDVGCGAGDKLLAMHMLAEDLDVFGIEYDPILASCARYICPFAHVIEGDALQQDYSIYDLIYMYRPIAHPKTQSALQLRVMRQMKLGSKLVVVYPEHRAFFNSDGTLMLQFPDLYAGWTKTHPSISTALRRVPANIYDFRSFVE